MRGEQRSSGVIMEVLSGPSPRARGADSSTSCTADPAGTIPACAGSSWSAGTEPERRRDHPRVRGEQTKTGGELDERTGPSPRARGAARRVAPSGRGDGTIPACAGSRPPRSPRTAPGRDHPRVRGEQISAVTESSASVGPSPRARGAESTTCELTSGKQPFFQLLQEQTHAPLTLKPPNGSLITQTPPLRCPAHQTSAVLEDLEGEPLIGAVTRKATTQQGSTTHGKSPGHPTRAQRSTRPSSHVRAWTPPHPGRAPALPLLAPLSSSHIHMGMPLPLQRSHPIHRIGHPDSQKLSCPALAQPLPHPDKSGERRYKSGRANEHPVPPLTCTVSTIHPVRTLRRTPGEHPQRH